MVKPARYEKGFSDALALMEDKLRAEGATCSRCGQAKVVNPRPHDDIVVCGDCGFTEGAAEVIRRVEAVLAERSHFVDEVGESWVTADAVRAALYGDK